MGGIIFYHMKNQRDNFRPPSIEYNINGSRRPGILSRACDTTLGRRLLGFYGGKGGGRVRPRPGRQQSSERGRQQRPGNPETCI